jgi:hypothetical protein
LPLRPNPSEVVGVVGGVALGDGVAVVGDDVRGVGVGV